MYYKFLNSKFTRDVVQDFNKFFGDPKTNEYKENYSKYPDFTPKDVVTVTTEPTVAYKKVLLRTDESLTNKDCTQCIATLVFPTGTTVIKPKKFFYEDQIRADGAVVVKVECPDIKDEKVICTSTWRTFKFLTPLWNNFGFYTLYYEGKKLTLASKFNMDPYECSTSGIHGYATKQQAINHKF